MAKSKRVANKAASPGSPAKQLAGFIAKFDPKASKLIRQARAALRKRLPTAIEQVYDNYNFLAIGYCTAERTSDCIVSLAASANGVILSFYYGAALPDPNGVLLGSGKQNRFVRLENSPTWKLSFARQLRKRRGRFSDGRRVYDDQVISAKQRPRRKTKAA